MDYRVERFNEKWNLARAAILLALGTLAIFFSACTKKPSGPTVWIYTSIYKNVISDLEPLLQKKFPGVKFEWFQSGSENVAARLNAELSSGKGQADLLLTSDPLWYVELKKAGHLLPYISPAAARVAEKFRDPENTFVTVRIPVAVIGRNTESVTEADGPQSWGDLTLPKWKGKVSMGSPMESGTFMLATAQIVRKNGWDFFQRLRTNELLSAGGNSAVINRIETKERPVGIVLLENILEAKQKASPVEAIYPKEGAILIPSPMAILKGVKNEKLVKEVYDYFLSDEMQQAIVKGRMYSPVPSIASPEGARPFATVLAASFEWSPAILEELYSQREAIKKKFHETVLQ